METEGTRGESLREWVKEREWCGVMLQKVRIIHTSLDQRRISCWSTVQSFDMEGREGSAPIVTVCGCSMMETMCTPTDGSKGSHVHHLLNHAT